MAVAVVDVVEGGGGGTDATVSTSRWVLLPALSLLCEVGVGRLRRSDRFKFSNDVPEKGMVGDDDDDGP